MKTTGQRLNNKKKTLMFLSEKFACFWFPSVSFRNQKNKTLSLLSEIEVA